MDDLDADLTLPEGGVPRSAVAQLRPAEGVPVLADPVEKPPLLPGKQDLTKIQRSVVSRQRQQHVIVLRRAGASFDDIGRQLKVSGQSAWRLYNRAMARAEAGFADDVNYLRRLELERLDAMLLKAWQIMTAKESGPVEAFAAIDRILKIQDSRRRYVHGLEKGEAPPVPDEQAIADRAITPFLKDASVEELRQFRALIQGIQARQGGTVAPPAAEEDTGSDDRGTGGGSSSVPRQIDT